jgi:hypothetical protein
VRAGGVIDAVAAAALDETLIDSLDEKQIRQAIDEYLRLTCKRPGDFLFAGRSGEGHGHTTRQYARLVGQWIASTGLDPLKFGTHSLPRTKATLI